MGHTRPDLNAESLETAKPDWEVYCAKVADSIVEKQDPERLLQVRSKLYELLSHCIPPVIILKVRSSLAQSCRARCKKAACADEIAFARISAADDHRAIGGSSRRSA